MPSPSGINSISLPSTSGLASSRQSSSISSGAKASSHSHPWRLKKGKQKMPPKQEFRPKAIHLLDMYMVADHDKHCDEDFIADYPVKDKYILLNIELGTAQTQNETQSSICEVIKQRFPTLKATILSRGTEVR